jgi:hypothetical protein
MSCTLLRLCLVIGAALAATGFACDRQPEAVALRSNTPAASAGDLLAGDTIAVVRLDPSAPATIASTPAGHLLGPFRTALDAPARPATSPSVTVPLAEPPHAGLSGVALEIVLFTDLNHDAAWQRGEPYATAWSGGRGGYRITVEMPAPPERPRWRLLEGGEPPTVHPNPADLVVYIDPVRPAVER